MDTNKDIFYIHRQIKIQIIATGTSTYPRKHVHLFYTIKLE
jgi:hypothetical protein